MTSTLQQYLDEVLYVSDGKSVKRRDEISISRKKFLEEIWPIAFNAGYKKAVDDGKQAERRTHQKVKMPGGVIP